MQKACCLKELHEKIYSIPLKKGDEIYIFTDGYADQFGGPKGKKFKYSQLKSLLISMFDKTMEEQKSIIEKVLEVWQGDLEQEWLKENH
ncbi:MAG: hypothetical protein H0V01_08435 [Bacteroidetes bacterium]|nr:hypothetical protein [Bacteroidota bacterium]HET6243735.1 hypothetical protein [Bacteroidia bacterium]